MKAFDLNVVPGFLRFDLPIADEGALREMVSQAVQTAPPHVFASVASGLHAGILGMFDHLVADGCFLVFLASPKSLFAASQPMLAFRQCEAEIASDPMTALSALAASNSSAVILDIDPAVCLRTHQIIEIDMASSLQRAEDEFDIRDSEGRLDGIDMHRLTAIYTLGVPGEPDSWFEAVGVMNLPAEAGQEPDQAAALGLFDGIMTTFRWCNDA